MASGLFFKKLGPLALEQVARIASVELIPSANSKKLIYDVKPLDEATQDDISVLHNSTYLDAFIKSSAGAIILEEKYVDRAPKTAELLLSKAPYLAYGKVAGAFYTERTYAPSLTPIHPEAQVAEGCQIHPMAVIESHAQIGKKCVIGANSYIGPGVIIGENSFIGANVTISHAFIGKNVRIHPGASIGQPGFGAYLDYHNGHLPIPQLGSVIIQDNVRIGANTTIDRGSSKDTIIGEGTYIDNLVQIAHNVEMGKNCVILAQVGISGSTKIGNAVTIAGQAGIIGHLQIGDGAVIAAQSGVMKNIASGERVGGSPAVPVYQWHKQTIAISKLIKKVK